MFCIHAYLFTRCVPGVQHRPEKSIKTHWDWSCELPSRKTELWSSSRAESSLNHWAISPGSPKHDRGVCMCMYVCQIYIPNIVIHRRLHDNQEFTVLVVIPKVLVLCSNNYLQRQGGILFASLCHPLLENFLEFYSLNNSLIFVSSCPTSKHI